MAGSRTALSSALHASSVDLIADSNRCHSGPLDGRRPQLTQYTALGSHPTIDAIDRSWEQPSPTLMINGRLFVQNIADTQIQFCCAEIKRCERFRWLQVERVRHALVSFHRRRENWERQVSSPAGKAVCFVRFGGISGFDELPGAGWTRMGQDWM